MEFCPDCMRHPRAFEYGIALLNYDEAARHSMAQIKYNNKESIWIFTGQPWRHGTDGRSAGCRRMSWFRYRSMPRGKRPGIQSGRDSGSGHRKEAGDSGNTGNAGEK